jgi:hypothetical protein
MSKYVGLVLIVWGVFMAWSLAGWMAIRNIEHPGYAVIERRSGYEVRRYDAFMLAQVQVRAPWRQALSQASATLDDYFSGNNTMQASITASRLVHIESEAESETIALVAPVIQEQKKDFWVVSFVVPSRYTWSTVPRPNDPQIRLVEVPAHTTAVRIFGGWIDQAAADARAAELRELLTKDHETILGLPQTVQYGPAWTPPFLWHNEVLLTIR